MQKYSYRFTKILLAATAAIVAGCSSVPNKAPVEARDIKGGAAKSGSVVPAQAVAAGAAAPDLKALPGAENAGKAGYYTVKPGDTLIRIALDNGQSTRDLIKWNVLDNPNRIEVGQVLRVVAPGIDAAAVTSKSVTTAKVESRPLDAKGNAAAAAASSSASAPASPAVQAAATPASKEGDEDPAWGWPAAGPVNLGFDDQRNKGLAFFGKAGDAVLAAADGRVVYAGSGLRGYGNLVIIKHNSTYLTAYAHNQTLLVKEDQAVRKGQKIAEMGSSDSDQVKLHFEVRKQGKPIDPAKLLPGR
ncbi:peptidoglycan DD-metalloendopeptidase family protein [Roseateles sp.]|uniref:peptidoglycan DD-metalloendopeptidase family protein n=1 Tax=Roseateles sp. TaxID=1971397 RepID=UPI00286D3ED5|nr:peptidoglycan DD-metalloendopeptidase family protein [Roseateles sp.]